MRPTVQAAMGALVVKTVDAPPSTSVNCVDWLGLVSRALGKSSTSHKAAAADMAIDPGLLSAQLAGAPGKHLSWTRMGHLSPAFWQELVLLVIDFYDLQIGISEQDRRDLELGRTLREAVQRSIAR